MTKTAFGVIFKMADSGSSPVAVANCSSVQLPSRSRATVESTTHDNPNQAKTFVADGTYDPGEITIQGHYVAGSSGDDAFIAALTSGTVQDWEALPKADSGTETQSGSAIVTDYGPDGMEIDGLQTFSATLKVTGAIAQDATP